MANADDDRPLFLVVETARLTRAFALDEPCPTITANGIYAGAWVQHYLTTDPPPQFRAKKVYRPRDPQVCCPRCGHEWLDDGRDRRQIPLDFGP